MDYTFIEPPELTRQIKNKTINGALNDFMESIHAEQKQIDPSQHIKVRDTKYTYIYKLTYNKDNKPIFINLSMFANDVDEKSLENVVKDFDTEMMKSVQKHKIYSDQVNKINMLNYTFLFTGIYYELSKKELNDICDIINDYSFPCILKQTLFSDDEDDSFKKPEIEILYDKIANDNTLLIKIPRVIYDLCNILFNLRKDHLDIYDLKLEYDKSTGIVSKYDEIDISNTKINHYNYFTYNQGIDIIYKENRENIINLNKFILNIIKEVNNNTYHNLTKQVWISIFEKIFSLLNNQDFIEQNKFNLFQQNGESNILDETRIIPILKKVLEIELCTYDDNSNDDKFIIYRGLTHLDENPIGTDKKYSLSYNTSVLNSILNDKDACTLFYFDVGSYKQYIILNKFTTNYHNPGNLFFIPPIHPYILLIIGGEFWHVRSLFQNNINKILSVEKNNIQGIAEEVLTPMNKIPNYLISTLSADEIKIEFNKIHQTKKEVINKEYKKYLKYKTKYLELKKNLPSTYNS